MSSSTAGSSQKRRRRAGPAAARRSTFAIKLAASMFLEVLDAMHVLSKARLQYLSYPEAVRLALLLMEDLDLDEVLELYRAYETARHSLPVGLDVPVSFSVNLNEADRAGIAKVATDLQQSTGTEVLHRDVIVFVLLSIPIMIENE
jgi:hypothetical protein